MSRIAFGLAAVLALVAAALFAGGAAATQAADAGVSVQDFQFAPPSVTITAGGTVTWTWSGAAPHNVTSDTGAFTASATQSSGTFSQTFNTPGTYYYHCTIHGAAGNGSSLGSGMAGVVVVQAAAPTDTPQPTNTAVQATATSAPPTSTPRASVTAAAATSTPVRAASAATVAAATSTPAAGAAGAGALPAAGTGGGGAHRTTWIAIALGAAAAVLAGAGAFALVRRRSS